jgi:SpoIID/LytB domain protein
MKLKILVVAAMSVLALSTSPAQADGVPAHFVLTGSGFGHGVGMSQIGAQGQAMEGKSATDILTYWFPGTSVVPVNDNLPIRVNVAHQASYATFSIVKPALGATYSLTSLGTPAALANPNPITNSANCVLKFSVYGKSIAESTTCPVGTGAASSVNSQVAPAALWNISWNTPNTTPLGQILNMSASSASMQLKYGFVQLKYVAGKIEITDTMNLHNEYLYGISEMPSSYLPTALQAQVIASRTYALAKIGTLRKECDCNIYSSMYDQSYIGYAKEAEAGGGQQWRAAVDATNPDSNTGFAIIYQGKPISVYFFASDGGTTQRSVDVWGTSQPYLTNVPDPWSLDIFLNPYYSHWQRVLVEKDVATAFNLTDVVSLKVDALTSAGAALSLTATSSTGATSQLQIGDFKTKLKIPSSWFQIAPPGY